MLTMEAHQIHLYADSSSGGSEERLSDFDEEYYKYRPPALIIRPDQTIIVEPEPEDANLKEMDVVDASTDNKPLKKDKGSSWIDCIISCLTCCF